MQMKKIKWFLKILLLLFLATASLGYLSKQYRQFKLHRGFHLVEGINKGHLYINDEHLMDSTRLLSLINFINISTASVDSLLKFPVDNLKVFIKSGDASTVSFIDLNTIQLNLSEHCFSPFIHEYLHLVLRDYDEFWFQEGSATYLSQYIRHNHEQLKKYCEANSSWFNNRPSQERGDLVPILDLTNKYSEKEFLRLLKTDKYEDLSSENIIDFYRISAAFCQEIVQQIGINTFLAVAKSRTFLDRSIKDELLEEGIIIDQFMEEWTDELYIAK
jgi:hypothetical protein